METLRHSILGRRRPSSMRDNLESQAGASGATRVASIPSLQMEEQALGPQPRRLSLSRSSLQSFLYTRASVGTDSQPSQPGTSERPEMDSSKSPTYRYTLTLSDFSTSRIVLPYMSSPVSTNGFHSPTRESYPRSSNSTSHVRSPVSSPSRTRSPTASSVLSRNPSWGSRRSRLSRESNTGTPSPVLEDPIVARPTHAVHVERPRTVRFQGVEPEERRAAQELQINLPAAEDEEHRSWIMTRHNWTGRRNESEITEPSSNGQQQGKSKRFLFCFPWIQSQRARNQALTSFVSGLFLLLMLGVCKSHLADNVVSHETCFIDLFSRLGPHPQPQHVIRQIFHSHYLDHPPHNHYLFLCNYPTLSLRRQATSRRTITTETCESFTVPWWVRIAISAHPRSSGER